MPWHLHTSIENFRQAVSRVTEKLDSDIESTETAVESNTGDFIKDLKDLERLEWFLNKLLAAVSWDNKEILESFSASQNLKKDTDVLYYNHGDRGTLSHIRTTVEKQGIEPDSDSHTLLRTPPLHNSADPVLHHAGQSLTVATHLARDKNPALSRPSLDRGQFQLDQRTEYSDRINMVHGGSGTNLAAATSSADSIKVAPSALLSTDSLSIRLEDIATLQNRLTDGGALFSLHSPNDAVTWVEAHYDDLLLSSMRSHGLGGPIAAMVSPDEPALAIFGSILDSWALKAAKQLSKLSNFTVMIRPLAEDPVTLWARAAAADDADTGISESGVASAVAELHSHPLVVENISAEESKNPNEGETDEPDSDVGSSDTDVASDGTTSQRGKARRLRGGASESDSEGEGESDSNIDYTPWFGPVHNLDLHLKLCHAVGISIPVTLRSKTQFTVQEEFEDKFRHGYRPHVISLTRFTVDSKPSDVLPDRSYSSIGFLAHNGYIKNYKKIDCAGFSLPNYTTKTVETETNQNTLTANLVAGAKPTGGLALRSKAKAVENANDSPKNRKLPSISFISRNQTMLWISNNRLKAKGLGLVVLTSSYIPNIKTTTELYIIENQTVKLVGTSLIDIPATDKKQAKYDASLSLSIGALHQSKRKFGFLKDVSKKLHHKARAGRGKEFKDLPLHEFMARGWDAINSDWRFPVYPELDANFRAPTGDSTAIWNLVVPVNGDEDSSAADQNPRKQEGNGVESTAGISNPGSPISESGNSAELKARATDADTDLGALGTPVGSSIYTSVSNMDSGIPGMSGFSSATSLEPNVPNLPIAHDVKPSDMEDRKSTADAGRSTYTPVLLPAITK
ncbi:hypothetical protein B0H10DRAFT_1943032 [Mycena sp. CBHHK59/15]|nr:hypothetical protein B0H10DRAFT_1943032 [Mycena sp. CBHHK59/15]